MQNYENQENQNWENQENQNLENQENNELQEQTNEVVKTNNVYKGKIEYDTIDGTIIPGRKGVTGYQVYFAIVNNIHNKEIVQRIRNVYPQLFYHSVEKYFTDKRKIQLMELLGEECTTLGKRASNKRNTSKSNNSEENNTIKDENNSEGNDTNGENNNENYENNDTNNEDNENHQASGY